MSPSGSGTRDRRRRVTPVEPPVRSDYDAIVVGLGGIGSAAAYALAAARPGVRVLGLEQFELDHARGASQDVSRIIRLSYHRPEYVRLARRAYEAWRTVEAETGEPILTITGGIDLAPPGAAESIDDYAAAMAADGVAFERLGAAEAMRRWPQWRVAEGTQVLFQADAGIADPERGNEAHRRLARAHGATLLEQTPVVRIEARQGERVVVTADGRAFSTGSVIVAADAWTNQLLGPIGARLPLTVTEEQVTWFAPATEADAAAFAPDRFPIWIWLDQPSFYGFPTHRGPGPKVGQDVGGRVTTADDRTFEPNADAVARVDAFLHAHLPAIAGRAVRTKTCLYTLTPDRDFVLDRVPGQPDVVVALGAAHAYKFAALFGRILAQLALDPARAAPPAELAIFRLDRPALTAIEPAGRLPT
jgi:sarcosine oxidase